MKGAILSIAPDAQLVDVLHEVDPHDVEGGALALAAAYPSFPRRTVFVAVVDPGVGSSRRGLAVATKSYRFVAPDNGLLTEVLAEHPTARVHTLTNRRLWNAEVAPTFHARDVFGPVAAHLARGTRLDRVGPKVADAVRLPAVTVRALGADAWEGRVVLVDRFGNLITNVTVRALDGMIAGSDRTDVVVRVGGVIAPLVRTYSDVLPGEPCALVGSSGRLELALNGGSAASVAGVGRGASVLVRRVYQPAI
jgi:S-adenosylmethionine hydrolase